MVNYLKSILKFELLFRCHIQMMNTLCLLVSGIIRLSLRIVQRESWKFITISWNFYLFYVSLPSDFVFCNVIYADCCPNFPG